MIAAAEGGLLHITGETDGRPVKPGVGLTDMCTGLYMHGAILAAIRARDVTGKGQQIDTSLFETQVSLLCNVAMSWLNAGQEAQRWGTGHPSIVPYDCFKSADSYFTVGAVNTRQFVKLCQLVGSPELGDDPRFVTNDDRVKNRVALGQILEETFAQQDTRHWMEVFEGSGMPYGPINNMKQVFEHPQIEARQLVETVEDDGVQAGHLKLLGTSKARPFPPGASANTIARDAGQIQ